MPNFAGIASALAGAGRGYEASQGRPSQGPQGKGGLLMNYLNKRKLNRMPPGPAGLPEGSMPDPMQGGPAAGPAPQIPQNPNAAMPGPALSPPTMAGPQTTDAPGTPVKPPYNQYEDPYGMPPGMKNPNAFAQGKIVDKPTTALLGEDGPEAVIPLNGRSDAKVSTANLPQMKYRRGGY